MHCENMKVLSASCCFLLLGALFSLVRGDARAQSSDMNMRTLLDEVEEECPLVASCCEEDCCGKKTSWDPATRYCVVDKESDGFDGTHSDLWIPGCVERACCNQDCCSTSTEYNEEIASCVPTTTSCVPTTGPCVATFSQFQQVASEAMDNDVIALCGGKEIVTQTAVVLNKPKMTLCCAATDDKQDCIVKSAGTDRNLAVTGPDFTVQDIFFYNGNFDGDKGGNVDISAPGNHVIEGCEFHNGRAILYGGNLHVQDADSVAIRKSTFANGNSPGIGGGGLAVWNTTKWSLDDCVLEGNSGYNGGGAFSSQLYPYVNSQSISITRTRFYNNSATFGGGYMATTLGSLPSLLIHDCVFDDNVADNDGGAAMVIHYAGLSTLDLSLSGNAGSGNDALGEDDDCDDFSIPGQLCIGVSEDFQA